MDKGSIGDAALRSAAGYSAPAPDVRSDEGVMSDVRVIRAIDGGSASKCDHEQKTESCLRLLADAASSVACGVAERYRRLELSVAAGNEFKEDILRRRWAREVRVRFDSRNITALSLTGAGVEALRQSSRQGDYATPDDHAGPIHEFWKAWLFQELRKRGLHVDAEYALSNGHRVDLLVNDSSTTVAIEIETGKSDAKRNLQAVRAAGISRCVVVTVNGQQRLETVEGVDDQLSVQWVATAELPRRIDDIIRNCL